MTMAESRFLQEQGLHNADWEYACFFQVDSQFNKGLRNSRLLHNAFASSKPTFGTLGTLLIGNAVYQDLGGLIGTNLLQFNEIVCRKPPLDAPTEHGPFRRSL